jgi:hypothetical protein
MKFNSTLLVSLFVIAAIYGLSTKSGEPDPYEPLKLYDGTWKVQMVSGGTDKKSADKPDVLSVHCARTGKFFSCEQELNGQPRALVIFCPTVTSSSGALEYRTLVARADLSKPDDWEHLVIEGDTWTYTWTQKDGDKVVSMRNVNHFAGKDRIHFEVQKLEDNASWKTQVAGDEERVK